MQTSNTSSTLSTILGFVFSGVTIELITNTIIVAILTGFLGGCAGYLAHKFMKKVFKDDQ
jgi:uncharacterized membrane-anchored protein